PGCLSTNYPPHPTPSLFFFYSTGDHRDLHSFPTRRSSDLWSWQNKARQPSGNGSAAVKPQLAQADCISSLWLICCAMAAKPIERSEEHTSELQSRGHLVCRLLLEKKKRRRATRHDHELPVA